MYCYLHEWTRKFRPTYEHITYGVSLTDIKEAFRAKNPHARILSVTFYVPIIKGIFFTDV